jgi:hypothetical protein
MSIDKLMAIAILVMIMKSYYSLYYKYKIEDEIVEITPSIIVTITKYTLMFLSFLRLLKVS